MLKLSLVQVSRRSKLAGIRYFCVVLLLFFPLFAPLSFADIYRCISDSGVVKYSDQPCGQDTEIAFKTHKMSVEDAISRDIADMTAGRDRLALFQQDVEDHAKMVASTILPNQKLNDVYMNKMEKNAYNRDWNWGITLFYGYEGDGREWQISMIYEGRKTFGDTILIRLSLIRIKKNNRFIDPPTMQSVKTLKKIKTGEWKY